MDSALAKLTIKGFKSIRELQDFELQNLNVLIGGNGSGKSNFIEIFRMLRAMMYLNFANYVMTRGGADDFLFNGPKQTPYIMAHFVFGKNEYGFELVPTVTEKFLIRSELQREIISEFEPTANEKFLIKSEAQRYIKGGWQIIGANHYESRLPEIKNDPGIITQRGIGHYVFDAISEWVVYHFHDTGSSAPMRRSEIVEDNKRLRPNAANIAPLLLNLKISNFKCYQEIVDVIRLVTPFFDNFILEPVKKGEKETVKLSWKQKGSDYPMQPYHFSDGTIRFICLATALLQPFFPSTIVIDEPELGLHPYAIEILSELIRAAAHKTQVIVSTQSPALVNHFVPEDIIVVDREDGASTFKRLKSSELTIWLEDYAMGELWVKNVFSGSPSHE